MDLFLLKKIIIKFVMPINLILFFLILALIFHRRKPKLSIGSLILGVLLLLLSTMPPVADQFMLQLEKDYPAYTKQDIRVDYIVVLGCRYTYNPDLPVTSQLGDCSLQRTVEALRIYKLHPEARIITSGHGAEDEPSNAETVKQSLVLLGVPEQKIMTEDYPRDTHEEAQFISTKVIEKNVILITNADHMQRAMRYFESEGVYPIPAPTGFWVKRQSGETKWSYFLPSGKDLYQTTVAWYESLGQLVQWIKEKVSS